MFGHRNHLLLAAVLLGWASGVPSALAHEDLAIQVRALTERLAKRPAEASLRLRRADLYIRHGDWEHARADLDHLERQGSDPLDLVLHRARIDLGQHRPADCLQRLERVIAQRPHLPALHFYRGRALALLEKPVEAAEAFTEGITALPEPRPEHFMERAKALASDPRHLGAAIESLDEGLERLPGNLALEHYALQLERQAGRRREALLRIQRVQAVQGELPLWLLAEGDLLLEMDRREEARESFARALRAIERLPIRRRDTAAVTAQNTRATEGLAAASR